MKKSVLLLLAFLVQATLFAQLRLHIGANTGVNSSFVLDKGLKEDPRYNSKMTYTLSPIGVSFGADFSRGFSLQLEGIWAKYGQIYQIVNVAQQVVGERRIDLSYINLPLLLRFVGNVEAPVRFNFMFGPQLSLLTMGRETIQYAASTFRIPQNVNELPTGVPLSQVPDATQNPDGTWNLPEQPKVVIAEKGSLDPLKRFRDAELQLAGGMGVDIKINDKWYASSLIRANYSIMDTRGQDLFDAVQNGTTGDLFGRRANLQIGIQLGVHHFLSLGK